MKYYDYRQQTAAETASTQYIVALRDFALGKPDDGQKVLEKFIPSAPRGYATLARLRLAASERWRDLGVRLEVEDNGPGVPEEIRDSLFEPFVTAKAKGTGLGLALVAKIIEEHGGLIEHEQLDRRTIFRVALPVSEQGE